MNQKLEVKLVDMGTNSEERCNAASFLMANPSVQTVRSPKPYSSSPPLGQPLGTAGDGGEGPAAPGSGAGPGRCCGAPGATGMMLPRVLSLCPLGSSRGKGQNHRLPATSCRNGWTGCAGTNAREERSLRLWCLKGLGTEDAMELLRPWAAFLGARGQDPLGATLSSE